MGSSGRGQREEGEEGEGMEGRETTTTPTPWPQPPQHPQPPLRATARRVGTGMGTTETGQGAERGGQSEGDSEDGRAGTTRTGPMGPRQQGCAPAPPLPCNLCGEDFVF